LKSEISELLSCISKEEFERFGDFIRSPYFNKLPRMIKLYEFLYEDYNDLQKGTLSRESISKYMYPGEEFRNDSIRKLLSEFDKLLENFAAQIEFEKTEWDKKIYTLKALRERNCDKFEKRLKDYNKEHKNSTEGFDEFYATRLKLISEEFDFYFSSNLNEQNQINQEKSDAIDNEFIAKKLFLFQYMKSREYVNKEVKYSYTFWEEIEDHIKKNKASITKIDPELYRNFLGTQYILSNESEKILEKIKQFIDEQKYYEKKMGKPYWDYINYCMVQTNNGKDSYYENIFEYLKLLDEKELLSNGTGFNQHFFSIASAASRHTKEYDWLESFISKYKNKLKKEFRDDTINSTYALLYFDKGDYEKAKHFACKIGLNDFYLYISAKYILIKIAYEFDDIVEISNLRDTFKKYLSSHPEVPIKITKPNLQFADQLFRLAKIKEKISVDGNDDYEVDEFVRELEKAKKDQIATIWLKEKARQIKKR